MGQSEVIVTCANPACNKLFAKPLAEFKRSAKLGRPHFCSLKCFGQVKGIQHFPHRRNLDTSHLRKGSERDELSPFRYPLKIIHKSAKQRNKEASVLLLDLKFVWEQQKGICPYTGWHLVLLPCVTDCQNTPLTPNRASVDRLDSSRGYTLDNIQFVAVIANLAKNIFSEKDLLEFCYATSCFKGLVDKELPGWKNFNEKKSYKLVQPAECTQTLSPFSRRDEYSPFRQHIRLARRNAKYRGQDCTITLEYLKELWENQHGRCAYAGWELDNPQTTNEYIYSRLHPRRASLDRIDSSIGYVPGNVQFVSVMANYGKSDFHSDALLEFCQAVVEFRLKGK